MKLFEYLELVVGPGEKWCHYCGALGFECICNEKWNYESEYRHYNQITYDEGSDL